MPHATLRVAGRRYDIACREGEQAHLESLAAVLDAKAQAAAGAMGGMNEARQLLLAGILLADELHELRAGHAPPEPPSIAPALETLADRLESLAARLEKDRGTP